MSTSEKVPLFIAKTSILSQRSSGYVNTHSAVHEFIDNSIEAGAKRVYVYYLPRRQGNRVQTHDIVVLDDGRGMTPEQLKNSLAFGGGDRFDRKSIGRFGYGLPNGAISQGRHLDVYSWQSPDEVFRATLDVDDVVSGDQTGIDDPDVDDLPRELLRELTRTIGNYPPPDEQGTNLMRKEDWPQHGTLVHVSKCDRLTKKMTKPLVEHSRYLGRVYRHKIWESGVRIYVNNRLIQTEDPLFLNKSARHSGAVPWGEEIRFPIPVIDVEGLPEEEAAKVPKADAVARFSILPEEWMGSSPTINRNQLHLSDRRGISVVRAGREMDITLKRLVGITDRDVDDYWGAELIIPTVLDDAMGINTIKEGVRPLSYALEIIEDHLAPIVAALRAKIAETRKRVRSTRKGGEPTATEKLAGEAEKFLGPGFEVPQNAEFQQQVELVMREYAKGHCRDGETPEQAYSRIKKSAYLLEYEHAPEGPFYRADLLGNRVITIVNRAHPFYDKLWDPELTRRLEAGEDGESGDVEVASAMSADTPTSLALMLMSLARAEMTLRHRSKEGEEFFRSMRNEWSNVMRKFLMESTSI